MKKITFVIVFIVSMMSTLTLTSCVNDDDQDVISLAGTSWKVIETDDENLTDVILTFRANGDVNMSKQVEGWDNATWNLTQGVNSSGKIRYVLTVSVGDGYNYAKGYFIMSGANRADYSYSWYDEGHDEYSVLTEVHGLTLTKL